MYHLSFLHLMLAYWRVTHCSPQASWYASSWKLDMGTTRASGGVSLAFRFKCFVWPTHIKHHVPANHLEKSYRLLLEQMKRGRQPLKLKWAGPRLRSVVTLTHWGRDKMAAIFHKTFSNRISWMKMFEFRLTFHRSLFLGVQLTIFQHWFR